MRVEDRKAGGLSRHISVEQRVPKDHPLKAIRAMTDEALRSLFLVNTVGFHTQSPFEGNTARRFFEKVLSRARKKKHLSDEKGSFKRSL